MWAIKVAATYLAMNSAVGPERQILRRANSVAIGGKADVAQTPVDRSKMTQDGQSAS